MGQHQQAQQAKRMRLEDSRDGYLLTPSVLHSHAQRTSQANAHSGEPAAGSFASDTLQLVPAEAPAPSLALPALPPAATSTLLLLPGAPIVAWHVPTPSASQQKPQASQQSLPTPHVQQQSLKTDERPQESSG
jgi:hypothetical protein